jgi:antitoxin (DNA-binding transcriptional repressor) of toxin-antitoxin stability system
MARVGVEEIQQDLPAYLQRGEDGETVIIIRAGKPVAEVKPVLSRTETLRPSGLCAGEFTDPDDFDAPFADRRGYSMRDARFWMKITKRHKRQGARHKVS